MYAVLVTGGKQYRVMQGETLRVELLEAEAGSEIKLDNVLMLGDADGIKLGDALMMDYVCELIAAGGAEGLTSVDASVESHVMALAAEHSRTHGGSAVELAEFTEK